MADFKPRKLTKDVVIATKKLLAEGNDMEIVGRLLGFTAETADAWLKAGKELRAEYPDRSVEEWVAWSDSEGGNLTPAFSISVDLGQGTRYKEALIV